MWIDLRKGQPGITGCMPDSPGRESRRACAIGRERSNQSDTGILLGSDGAAVSASAEAGRTSQRRVKLTPPPAQTAYDDICELARSPSTETCLSQKTRLTIARRPKN